MSQDQPQRKRQPPVGGSSRGSRHRARLRAVEILFEAETRDVPLTDVLRERREIAREDQTAPPVSDYTATAVAGVDTDSDQIDAVLASHLTDWSLDRLPSVDRAILRLATWELFSSHEVPPVVAVDEAVELAKELSTDESPSFVNGVLGRIVKLAPHVRAAALATRIAPQDDANAIADEV